jgi:hypothetical protein
VSPTPTTRTERDIAGGVTHALRFSSHLPKIDRPARKKGKLQIVSLEKQRMRRRKGQHRAGYAKIIVLPRQTNAALGPADKRGHAV